MNRTERVARTSADLVAEQALRLREVFPEVAANGEIDFDKLRATLGDQVETGPERFTFSWAGKRDAITLLQTPSAATLVPCPKESINSE